MKTNIILVCLVLGSWVVNAQHDHAKHNDKKKAEQEMTMFKDSKIGIAYEHYILLKDALVASKPDEAKKAAGQLQKSLDNVSNGKVASAQAAKVASTSNLKDQRKAFVVLSTEMTTLVKNAGLSKGKLYVAYCPMVDAYWLSSEKAIKNPYYGDKMLSCGSVKETIQ